MKAMKKAVRFTAVLAALSLCLALAGCGEQSSNTPESFTSSPSPAEAGTPLENYLSSIRSTVDAILSFAEAEGIQIEIIAEGNSLVYSYQYTDDLVVDTALMKTVLDKKLDSVSLDFQEVLLSLQKAVPEAEAVTARYLDPTGQQITQRTWNSADSSVSLEDGLELEDYLNNTLDDTKGYTLEDYLYIARDHLPENQLMETDVKAEGNCLVYVYRYRDVNSSSEEIARRKEALDAQLAAADDVGQEMLAELKAVVPSAKATAFRYLDHEGQMITQHIWGNPSQELNQPAISDEALVDFAETLRTQMADIIDATTSQGMKMEVLAEGHTLVYRYQYLLELDGTTEELKATLDEGLEQNNDTFVQDLATIQAEVPSAEALMVQYWDTNGNLITQRVWDASSQAGQGAASEENDPLLEEFVEAVRAQMADQIETYRSQGFQVEVLVEGHSLVYRYQLLSEQDETIEELKATLDEGMDQNNDSYVHNLDVIQEEIPSVEALVLEYWDVNGNLITSREWR